MTTTLCQIEEQESSTRLCRTTQEFVERIIADGRFLDSFTFEPTAVAELLEVEIAPEVAEELRDRDPVEVLRHVTEQMTPCAPPERAGVVAIAFLAPAIKVSIVAVAGGCIYVAVGRTQPSVTDKSADADLKP